MDRISQLPNELLLRILSLLPSAKDVVATMVLSKRWLPLWKLVPKLTYDDSYQNPEYGKFSRFVDRSLFMHEAPVLETLHFKLGQICGSEDIQMWIRTAVAHKCSVRELIIEIDSFSSASPLILPRILYTGCRILVILKLSDVILVDVSSSGSFPSLKKLSLLSVKYPYEEFVQRLLSNCPVLECLYVEQCPHDNVTVYTVRVPSLKRLCLPTSKNRNTKYVDDGFVIYAPSLEYLDILDRRGGFFSIENEMPNVVKADVDVVTRRHPWEILRSITSVKRLYLCLSTSKDMYAYVGPGLFHHLVHFRLCTCETAWLHVLMCVLGASPNLRAIKLYQYHGHHETCLFWNEPTSVPECVLSSLETLEMVHYDGTEVERKLVGFILRNGCCLKKVTISSNSTDPNTKLEILKDLSLSFRRSPTLSTCIPLKLWSFSHEGSSNIWLLSQCLIRIFGYVET